MKMKKKRLTPDNPQQSEKFIQAAKELGCDESEEAFDEKLTKLLEKQVEADKDEA